MIGKRSLTLTPWVDRGLYLRVVLLALAFAPRAAAQQIRPPVSALSFMAGGQLVAVGSQEGVQIVRWSDLKTICELPSDLVNIHQLALSPDGHRLAVAGGDPGIRGRIEVFDVSKLESDPTVAPGPSIVLDVHDDSVLDVCWTGNHTLATASLDHKIMLWDLTEQKAERTLAGHSRGVTALARISDGLLVSGSIDQHLRIWNDESGEIERSLNNHTGAVHGISLRPRTSGLPMIASSAEDRTVRFWQPTIGRMVRFAKLPSPALGLAWTADGNIVWACAADGFVYSIDLLTTEISRSVQVFERSCYRIVIHPQEQVALVGGPNHGLRKIPID